MHISTARGFTLAYTVTKCDHTVKKVQYTNTQVLPSTLALSYTVLHLQRKAVQQIPSHSTWSMLIEFFLVKMNEESSHNSSQSNRIIKCLCLSSHRKIQPETLTETLSKTLMFCFINDAYYTNCASSCRELKCKIQ